MMKMMVVVILVNVSTFYFLCIGAVVLDEFTSENLRHTLDKLMTDCDRRHSMVQELITSSHRIQ